MDTLAPTKTVASVSLIDADRDPEGFSQELGRSFERYGFAIVADHGIPADLIHRAEEKAKAFFALPEEVKRKYHQQGGGGARGYTPFGIETAKGAVNYDLKEFWHVARELPPGHKYEDSMPPNLWPEEVDSFKATFLELFAAFDRDRRQAARGDRPLSRPRARLFRRHGEGRQFDPAPAPLSADPRRRPQCPRRRARGHQHDHPAARRRGGGPAIARPRRRLAAGRRRSRASSRSISATCCSG